MSKTLRRQFSLSVRNRPPLCRQVLNLALKHCDICSNVWTFLLGAISAEALESLLETQQYKDCLAALGLEQPPHHFTTDRYVSHVDIKGRMTIATLSFAYPATPEQREAFPYKASRVPVPGRFYEARNPMARGARAWVCGPQKLPDGREVENGLDFQPWRTREMEDVAAGEEREMRERWMSAIARRLGLLAVSVDRYDMYSL